MFLYHFFKPFIYLFLRVYYRIQVKGISHIPYGKPIILAPNHVNAFVDPIVLASMMKQRVWFFARSDVFKKPIANMVLRDFNIRPMYRIQEGFSNLKHNNKTFEECKSLLSKNRTILMFPEGICIMEQRLRKLKKGLSRIIFDTEESFNFKKEVLVIPIGLNYSKAYEFGSKFFVNIGKPIHISHYNEAYKNDKVKTINRFTNELEEKMREMLIHIKDPENDLLYEQLSEIYVGERVFNSKNKSLEKVHELNTRLANGINSTNTTGLKELTKAYSSDLKKHNISDKLLYKTRIESLSIAGIVGKLFLLFIGLPLFIAGVLTNYLPFFLAGRFAKNKVKNIEFFASIYLTFSMIGWLLFFFVQLLTIALFFKNWPLLGAYALWVIVTGIISMRYYKLLTNILSERQLLLLTKTSPQTITDLLMKRQEIIRLTDAMIKH